MRGRVWIPRWQTVLSSATIALVFGLVWWFAGNRNESTAPHVPDDAQHSPEITRWEQTGGRLNGIRIGMARAEVEAILGSPEPMNVDPVPRDQSTYLTRYPTFLHQPLDFAPDVRGFCDAELTYDASKPGHPLVRIKCTPRTPPPSRQTLSMAV